MTQQLLSPSGVAGVHHGDVVSRQRIGEDSDLDALAHHLQQQRHARTGRDKIGRDDVDLLYRGAHHIQQTLGQQGVALCSALPFSRIVTE
ncbi:hypothetical protein D3C78_1704870 [compost metagenome]